jgi:hypothetical protein
MVRINARGIKSKFRNEKFGVMLVVLVNNGFVSAFGMLLLVGMVEKLRSIEILLLGTDEVVQI